MIVAGRDDVPPAVEFAVLGVQPQARAAGHGLQLILRIDAGDRELRAVALDVRVQIRPERRRYSDAETARLWELFGPADQWARSLGPIAWGRLRVDIPGFVSVTTTEFDLPTGFDFGAAAPKYLDALDDGVVPLELLFSGTLTWTSPRGRPQTAMVPWDREAAFRMPAAAWRQLKGSP